MNYFYYDDSIRYPLEAPFGPSQIYPEYPFDEHNGLARFGENNVYDALRRVFKLCDFDKENYGTSSWNPFGGWVKPGDTVLIKPNLVMDHNPAEQDPVRGIQCMITHPSIVRFVFDYTVIALQGEGTIIVGDAPVQDCDFDKMKSSSGYDKLFDFMEITLPDGIEFWSGDFRDTCLKRDNGMLVQSDNTRKIFEGKVIDLAEESYFKDYQKKQRLRVTNYDSTKTVEHHINGKNEYCINSCVLKADVILNLCKPKTHRIAGFTGALKNSVGMNSRKEFLPHHTKGYIRTGGDEYSDGYVFVKFINSVANDLKNSSMEKNHVRLTRFFDGIGRKTGKYLDKKNPSREKFGMWHQNDTIWRTILDLNHLIIYCDKSGKLSKTPQRKMINFGDMIVSGEKEGPLCPSYKHVGGLLFSDSAVEFDYILVHLMGFLPEMFPVMRRALADELLRVKIPIILRSNDDCFNEYVEKTKKNFAFIPTEGWKAILSSNTEREDS